MSQFLLPCACGAKIPVNRSQAGMSLPCPQCGQAIDVPTIRKLAEFASVVSAKKAIKSNNAWNWLGPIAAISFIVGLIALTYGGYLAYERYSYISQLTASGANLETTEAELIEEIRKKALQSTPADTWDYWNIMIVDGLKDPDPPDLFKFKRYLASRVPEIRGSFITVGVCVAIFALCSFVMQRSRKN